MKTLSRFLVLISLLQVAIILSAQSPAKFNYQTVLRNNTGAVIPNHFVNFRFSIHNGSPSGITVYTETDTVTSNPEGIITVIIGGGSGLTSLNWDTAAKYMQVELDMNGGTNFVSMGATQLVSVPYALSAGNGIRNINIDSTGIVSVSTSNSDTLRASQAVWTTSGNANTSSANFIGTTSPVDLVFKSNNMEGLRLTSTNLVGLGGISPATTLDVNGGFTLRSSSEPTIVGATTITVGNRGLILITSSSTASAAAITLNPGTVIGQVVIFSGLGSGNNGVRFLNNTANGTRLGNTNRDLLINSNLTLMWNGINWTEIGFSTN